MKEGETLREEVRFKILAKIGSGSYGTVYKASQEGIDRLVADSAIAIGNAEYGIQRLREVPEEYVFYLRGTLASLRSIADYILEEANQKFKLGLPLTEPLYPKTIKDAAKANNNKKALQFIEAYEREWRALMRDPKVEAVLGPSGERNLVMHRKPSITQVQFIQLTPEERYKNVGEPTLHFIGKKDGEPSIDDIPSTLSHCLEKLANFRGTLVFGFESLTDT